MCRHFIVNVKDDIDIVVQAIECQHSSCGVVFGAGVAMVHSALILLDIGE